MGDIVTKWEIFFENVRYLYKMGDIYPKWEIFYKMGDIFPKWEIFYKMGDIFGGVVESDFSFSSLSEIERKRERDSLTINLKLDHFSK